MLKRFCILTLSLLCAVSGRRAPASEIRDEFPKTDARLSRPITLKAGTYLVGDLLSEVRRQTSVEIATGRRDLSTGTSVFAQCDQVPLCDLLDSLWSLLSSSEGKYRWYREGPKGSYRYEMYEPDAVKKRATKLNDYRRRAYLAYVDRMCDLSYLTPEQRERRKPEFAKVALEANVSRLDTLFKLPKYWENCRLFAELVPKSEREDVLLGRRDVNAEIAKMTPELKALAESVLGGYARRMRTEDGTIVTPARPDTVQIAAEPIGEGELVPQINVRLSQYSRSTLITTWTLGPGIAGVLTKLWKLEGDALTDKMEDTLLDAEKPGNRPAEDSGLAGLPLGPVSGPDLRDRLRNEQLLKAGRGASAGVQSLANRGHVAILAIVPALRNPQRLKSQKARTVKDYLALLEESDAHLIHKWRNSILLVNYPTWFLKNDSPLPYELVKQYLSEPGGVVSLKKLTGLLGRATNEEVAALSARYAIVKQALPLRLVFQYAQRRRDLPTPDGIPFDADAARFLDGAPPLARRPESAAKVERIRLTEESMETGTDRTILKILFEGKIDGQWRMLGAIIQQRPAEVK